MRKCGQLPYIILAFIALWYGEKNIFKVEFSLRERKSFAKEEVVGENET